jgi:hypothetical protein
MNAMVKKVPREGPENVKAELINLIGCPGWYESSTFLKQ